jgi:phosphoribosylformimino-5-aminoimidazole carboxamide ribotide isomerase
MSEFTIFPAIDLRHGQVVRLQRGDPARQTVYDTDPAHTALRWLDTGARWLHVVNLDASFGEPDSENQSAISAILSTAAQHTPPAQVQLGGGLRSVMAVEQAFSAGVGRAVLGTWAILQPQVIASLIARWGAERIAVSLDAEDGKVKVQGWTGQTGLDVLDLALQLKEMGLQWLIFTDIARDGLGSGLNLVKTIAIAERTGLDVIASGGVHSLEDVDAVRAAGLAGVIVGRALYDGSIDARRLLGS